MMRIFFVSAGLLALLGACSYVDAYEEAVYDMEPSYCYKSIGGVECYRKPYHRDERRLVNYFGPHPSNVDKPEAAEKAPHSPPKMVNYWVKDAEPIPRPAANGNIANLPWLDPKLQLEAANKREFDRVAAKPDGTIALLNKMGIGPHGEITRKRPRGGNLPGAREINKAMKKADQQASAGAPGQLQPPVIEVEVN